MNDSRLCVITGVTGALGPAIAAALRAHGFRVRGVSRHPPPSPQAGMEWVRADVADRSAIETALAGADVVVHLAALLHINDPPPAMRAEYERVNVTGTRNVAECTPPDARLVHVSTIHVYGDCSRGAPIDESAEPHPHDAYGRTKLEAEGIALQRGAAVLRLAAVYGAHVKGNYRTLVRAIARRRFVPLGDGRNRRTLIFDADVAESVVIAATHADAPSQVFNITDGATHTVKEIVDAIRAALGRGPSRLALPMPAVRAAASVAASLGTAIGWKSPLTPAMLAKYTEDVAVSGRKAERVLGFRPAYALRDGWTETVRSMRAAGEL